MSACRTVCIALMTWAFAVMFTATTALSADDDLPTRRVGISSINDALLVSFSYRDAFTEKVKKKLTSGLTTSVVVQLTLEKKGDKNPMAFWARTVEVTYDLWEEKFFVVREDDTGRRRAKVSSKKDAIDLAGILHQVALGPLSDTNSGMYRIHVKVETNPVSKEMLETIRTWLARSRAKKSGSIASSNYFGSFVGALVDRRISQAEHTIEFVSQWFVFRGL